METFVVVGIVGAALVVLTLLFGDLLDGVLEGVDLGGGIFSTPVIGGFLAAFGLAGALTVGALGAVAAALVGVVAGLVLGAATFGFTRRVMTMSTDATPRTADLVGRRGRVLVRVPEGGYGQVRVPYLGQQFQLSARATTPLQAGADVVVVEVLSATAVLVAPSGLPDP